jgi:RND family efflux transporter MFP subunit
MSHLTSVLSAAVLAVVTLASACGGSSSASSGNGPGGAGAPPATAVSIVTLAEKPVAETSEFIATLRSQRSTTIQPEVSGIVTRIFVKPGDRVRPGDPLVRINGDKQQAVVRSTEANRAGTEADVEYWRQQVKRLEALVAAGAISKQEFEQAQNSLRTAEARLGALNAEVREGEVELRYYQIQAPQAGVVGDIVIRTGDRITPDTIIATIDDNSALDADIQVPLDRAPGLRLGLPVHFLDDTGHVVATSPISFVSPRVDERTQTVLVKTPVKDAPGLVRVQQFARVRIVWRESPGLTIPLTAVQRISGLYFCFVAEQSEGGLVARQRPIEVGELLGNDYVVRSGLKAGERIITSGIQKIGNGAPVRAE